ncbi:MAG: hypothetical protein OEV30_00050 [Ignavibacteria bacterium]|nr:hypothetical protein [Ignavibacteria bacterium]
MKTRIAIPDTPHCIPLIHLLEEIDSFAVARGTTDAVARMLRRREVDVAFVSPMEYARESSEYRILPGYSVSSLSGIKLCFREGLRTIRSLAADPSRISEIVLAQIVLREEFESRPSIVPIVDAAVDTMLEKAEGALWLPGQTGQTPPPAALDLVEAWGEMVQLPYVHGVLCVREDFPASDGRAYLLESDLVEEVRRVEYLLPGPPELLTILEGCEYALDEPAREGIAEFLRYAHYHGMIRDVPSVRMYSAPDEENEN